MKQTFLLMVLAFITCSVSVTAQTKKQNTNRRGTTTRSTQQGGQVMKFRQVEEDGYVWYKLKRGNLYGARDADGNNIIPVKYDEVRYNCRTSQSIGVFQLVDWHYFSVKKNNYEVIYSQEGRLIISPDRHYSYVTMNFSDAYIGWRADEGILDMRGNVVIPPKQYKYALASHSAICVTDNQGKEGICNWNGDVVVPCQYDACWVEFKEGEYILTYEENGEFKHRNITFSTNTRFDYKPYDNLWHYKEENSVNNIMTDTKIETTPTQKQEKDQTIIIEPVPVQQWQACVACGGMGTMGCDNCGGSGTKYIGDRLQRCFRCNGQGIIPCKSCFGNKGQYITVYR